MSDGAQNPLVTVAAGQTAVVQLGAIPGGTCQTALTVKFQNARSFIRMSERPAIEQAFAFGLTSPPSGSGPPVPAPGCFLLVAGHTDQVGGASDNIALSRRRAQAALAVFTVSPAVWEAIYQAEHWNGQNFELATMSAVVDAGGSSNLVQQYLTDPAARLDLFRRYIIALRPDWLAQEPPSVRPELVTTPSSSVAECGFSHPIQNAPGRSVEENRRVEFFFFTSAGGGFVNCAGYPSRQVVCGQFITVTVVLTDECGAPYVGPFDLTLPHGGVLRAQQTDAQGSYTRGNVPQGRFTVEVGGWRSGASLTATGNVLRAQLLRPVTRAGAALRRGPGAFRFFGTNAYYLMESTAFALQGATAQQSLLAEFFRVVRDSGIRVVRTWGFNEDQGKPANTRTLVGGPLTNPTPGPALGALDLVVEQAELNGIYLVITLADYNPHYGGMCQYARWVAGYETRAPGGFPDHIVEELFYTGGVASDPSVGSRVIADPRDIYLDHACRVIGRFRQRTNILAWEMMNEPRVKAVNAPRGRQAALEQNMRSWIGTTALRIRQRCNPAPQLLSIGGVDINLLHFVFDSADVRAAIDLMDTHLYPENFSFSVGQTRTHLTNAVNEANARGVPFYLGEFGLPRGTSRNRPQEYQDWSSLLLGGGADGMLFWQLLPPSRGAFDPFEINVDVVPTPQVGPLQNVAPPAGSTQAQPGDGAAVVAFVNQQLNSPAPGGWGVC